MINNLIREYWIIIEVMIFFFHSSMDLISITITTRESDFTSVLLLVLG